MESIKGLVIYGKQEGRKLGFPTANVRPQKPLNLEFGIYAGYALAGGKKYQAALYVASSDVIEAFLLDFAGDLYNKELELWPVKKIRDVLRFENSEQALAQISKDILDIKTCLLELSKP